MTNHIKAESPFAIELAMLLNRHAMETQSGTPDFILAEYLLHCLTNYNWAVKSRDRFIADNIALGGRS